MKDLDNSRVGESGSDLPELMQAFPGWYPGAWAAPAETLTYSSILVTILGITFLLHREVDKVLFRFPFPPFILALVAALLAVLIAMDARARPGPWLPRVWVLLLAAASMALTMYGVVDQIRFGRSSPYVHIFSFVVLLSALALAPRLWRVSPFSVWVQHVAPISFVWVALLCVVGGLFVRDYVIRKETERITRSIDALSGFAQQVGEAAKESRSSAGLTLENISLPPVLPDSYVWTAAKGLEEERPTLLPDLTQAVDRLTRNVGEGLRRDDLFRIAGSPVRAANRKEDSWVRNSDFSASGAPAARYYRQLGRLQKELDAQTFASASEQAQYEDEKHEFNDRVRAISDDAGTLWIASAVYGDLNRTGLDRLVTSHVDNSAYSLGDLRHWKSLPWKAAHELAGHASCVLASDEKDIHYKMRLIPDDPYNRSERIEIVHYLRRLECYAYRPSSQYDAVEIAAELHLSYESWSEDGRSNGYTSPEAVRLYFEVPDGADAGKYEDEVVQRLRDAAPGSQIEPRQIHRIDAQHPCVMITVG